MIGYRAKADHIGHPDEGFADRMREKEAIEDERACRAYDAWKDSRSDRFADICPACGSHDSDWNGGNPRCHECKQLLPEV